MEYVQQFSPERVPEQEQQEEDEEDDDPLINYLRTFSYVQGAPALGVAEPNLMDLCLCILLILDEAVLCREQYWINSIHQCRLFVLVQCIISSHIRKYNLICKNVVSN